MNQFYLKNDGLPAVKPSPSERVWERWLFVLKPSPSERVWERIYV
jgi:hypothetical protein